MGEPEKREKANEPEEIQVGKASGGAHVNNWFFHKRKIITSRAERGLGLPGLNMSLKISKGGERAVVSELCVSIVVLLGMV